MNYSTTTRKANTFGHNVDDRTWSLAGLLPRRETSRSRTPSRRRRRMRGCDEPELPFWQLVYPSR